MKTEGLKKRNSSIELLRIIAALGVIILHYNNGAFGGGFEYVKENTFNQHYLRFTELMFICAVNLFVIISAYFLSVSQKRKLSRAAELFFQMEVFRLLSYFAEVIGGEPFSPVSVLYSLLPGNYFVMFYLVLYFVSPYINILIKSLNKENFKKLVILLFILFPVWNFFADFAGNFFSVPDGIFTVTSQGSGDGYTIVNFVLLYFIGAFLRVNDIKISKKQAITGMMSCIAVLSAEMFLEFACYSGTVTWKYDHPLVILFPVYIFLLFRNFEFESRLINELAKAVFTSFLFHSILLPYMCVERVVNGNVFILMAHQFGTAVALYLISYLVYKVYDLATAPMRKHVSPVLDKYDISVSDN